MCQHLVNGICVYNDDDDTDDVMDSIRNRNKNVNVRIKRDDIAANIYIYKYTHTFCANR